MPPEPDQEYEPHDRLDDDATPESELMKHLRRVMLAAVSGAVHLRPNVVMRDDPRGKPAHLVSSIE